MPQNPTKQPTNQETINEELLSNTWKHVIVCNHITYYLPTHPLGQDMTQGQFLSEV